MSANARVDEKRRLYTRTTPEKVGIYGASQMERRLRRSDNRWLGENRIVR
jgi:hypothetical protein